MKGALTVWGRENGEAGTSSVKMIYSSIEVKDDRKYLSYLTLVKAEVLSAVR